MLQFPTREQVSEKIKGLISGIHTRQEISDWANQWVAHEHIEGGPSIYIHIEETNAFLSFYKSDNGLLEVHFGGFGSPIKRTFNNSVYYIDFDHYIRMALDLCKDFAIIKLETSSI